MYAYQNRAGDVGTLFPAFQIGKGGLPCITKRARPGVRGRGGASAYAVSRTGRRCTPKRQWSQLGWLGRLKYVTFLVDAVDVSHRPDV